MIRIEISLFLKNEPCELAKLTNIQYNRKYNLMPPICTCYFFSGFIETSGLANAQQACEKSENLVVLGHQAEVQLCRLEKFLLENMYLHKDLRAVAREVKVWLSRVFDKFCARPELMPGYYQRLIEDNGLQRSVCDYISGMTDRYCLSMLDTL